MNRITFIWTCFSAFCDVGRRISAFTGRRIGVLALCLSALFCGFAAKGQTVSELGYYLGAYGKNAKIQQLGSGTDAVIYYEYEGTHYFVGTSGSRYFWYTLPSFTTLNGSLTYKVRDMLLVGRTLFLCGNMTESGVGYYTMEGHYVVENATYGFVMTVDVGDLLNPSSPTINIRYNPCIFTSDLSQLAVEVHGADTSIGVIGTCSQTGFSCLVCLYREGSIGADWIGSEYDMADTTEVLTDVVFTGKTLVTASRFGGEPYTFGIRSSHPSLLFCHGNCSEYDRLTKFDTEGMIELCDNWQNTWHKNDAIVRLIDVDAGNEVIAAYESRFNYSSPVGSFSNFVTLFHVKRCDMGYPVVADAKTIISVSDFTEVFKDMKYNVNNRTIALLRRSMTHNNYASGVTLFSWNDARSKETYSPSEDMSSFDLTDTTLMAVSNPRNSSRIEQFWKDIRYSVITCLPEESQAICSYNMLPYPVYSSSSVIPKLFSPAWQSLGSVGGRNIRYDVECTVNND